jgi:DNA-directed RNA polymerase specialized sigma24 family protein
MSRIHGICLIFKTIYLSPFSALAQKPMTHGDRRSGELSFAFHCSWFPSVSRANLLIDGQGREAEERDDPWSEEEQMELTQAFVDKDVRQLLVGGDADQAEAFNQVDTHLRKRFVKRLPGRIRLLLGPEDLADAWQDTLRDLLKAVRARDIDGERELCPRLWTIFIRRAFDCLRRKDLYEGLLTGIQERMSGMTPGDVLERMAEEERAQLFTEVRQVVDTLPARQRTVIETFVAHFPATEDMETLRRHVSEATGCDETRASVKRALQEARRKVSNLLKARHL